MKKTAIILLVLLCFSFFLTACAPKVQAQPDPEPAAENEPAEEPEKEEIEPVLLVDAFSPDIPALKDVYEGKFLVGAALNPALLIEGSKYYETAAKHYNVFVAENVMKPQSINPADTGNYVFTGADKLMDFCEAQGAALRGHTLCWYQQTPDFWFHDKETGALVSRDALLARMEDYITAVVSHCKGRVAVWDVVNEAISDSSGLRREDGGCFYPAIIGDLDGDGNDWDYIEKAFEFAHAADPDARLFLNEYSLESNKRKLDDFCRMLTDLMEKGVPVHGVGIQLHGNLSGPYASDVRRCIERLAQYKQYDPSFCVQITEMDLSIFASGDQKTRKALDTTTQAMLAGRYRELFDVFVEQAEKGNLDMVLTWGIYDGATWLDSWPVANRRDAPLLFDRTWTCKPAFWAVADPDRMEDALKEYAALEAQSREE